MKMANSIIRRSASVILQALLILLFLFHSGAVAQQQTGQSDYTIGPGDLLSLKFWQKPELDADVRVNGNGQIEVPLVGPIHAAGLTVELLRQRIINQVSLADVTVTQVAVDIKEFVSKSIYLTGAVRQPGKLNFENIPNLWQIILEAGGPAPNAMLSDVTIVRSGPAEAGKIVHIDLARAMQEGNLENLPPVLPGDTVHINTRAAPGARNVLPSPLERRQVVYVYGEVRQPGVINLSKNMDVMEAIVLAGGPTENANFGNVRIYFRGRRQAQMAKVDMNQYLQRSVPIPLTLHPGDAVHVPRRTVLSPAVVEVGRIAIAALGLLLFNATLIN